MKPIIEVNHLYKKYRIGEKQLYYSFRDSIVSTASKFKKMFTPRSPAAAGRSGEFWALKDVSFKVMPGEVIGIIGRNGAGKTTLLKILSQITPPTKGEITLRGRVASLLEVGTGFHTELTGRENIFLNGAILGMKRTEIREKFSQIVKFAEIQKFLDTPVKYYSSGMYMRLAFAVAAHLEPEILLIDEVLAVGDAQFQKKCLGKMEEVSKQGRTVLFVSHNMEAVKNLCGRCLYLDKGRILSKGKTEKIVNLYIDNTANHLWSVKNPARRGGSGGARIKKIWFTDSNGKKITAIRFTGGVNLSLVAELDNEYQNKNNIVVGFGIDTIKGERIITCVSSWVNFEITARESNLFVSCLLNNFPLINGRYLVSASISSGNDTLDYLEHCASIDVKKEDISFSKGRETTHGVLNVDYKFTSK